MSTPAQESPARVEDESLGPESWSHARWIVCVGLVFATHIGLIFAFGSRKPVAPRSVANAPQIQLAVGRSELQSLDDPTLFALPHPRGFTAATWLQLPRVDFAPFRWTEPPQLMNLPIGKLGTAIQLFAQTNAAPRTEVEILPPIQTTRLDSGEQQTSLKQHSTVTASGDVIKRRWLNRPALLRSWPAADLLTNSVVRVVVDPEGEIFSPVLLPPGSGSKAADQYALEIARTARFAPLPRSKAKPMIGAFVFEWHTVPMPETNAPSAKP